MAAARDDPGPPRELATLDKRLSFPVTREDSPKARIKSRCNIAHGRHTPIGDGDITRQQRDRTYSMVQHPAKCEPGIGGFRFWSDRHNLANKVALRRVLDTCDQTGWHICHAEFLDVLARGLVGLGQLDAALVAIEKALATAEHSGERYSIPELLRIK
jgi:hypothetical protein